MFILVTVLVLTLILVKIFSKLTTGRCRSSVCLVGKTALITGGNSGIGYHTALALAGRGCRIIIADRVNCDEAKGKIVKETGNSNVVTKHFDLASLNSVRNLAKDLRSTEDRLDILINNAGTGGLGNDYTPDGLHKGMQVNHFGSFLLTHLLIDLLKKSAPSRIIFVSSIAAFLNNLSEHNLNFPKEAATSYSNFMVYSNSKLCNIISANGFAAKLQGTGITANSLYPGIVYTPIYRKFLNAAGKNANTLNRIVYYAMKNTLLKLFAKDPAEGAQTTLHLALAKEVENTSGEYFVDCHPFLMPPAAKNQQFSEKIWKLSEDLVKLTPEEKL